MGVKVQVFKNEELLEEKVLDSYKDGEQFVVAGLNFEVKDTDIYCLYEGDSVVLQTDNQTVIDNFTIRIQHQEEDLDEFTLQFSSNSDEILIDDTVPAKKIEKLEKIIDTEEDTKQSQSEDNGKTELDEIKEQLQKTPESKNIDKDFGAPQFDDEPDEVTVVGFAGGGLLYQLSCIAGPSNGKVFNLEKSELIVGRDESADILLNDDSVSRRHAVLQRIGIHYYLTDLNSSNGTYLNGNKITSRVRLNSNDVIEFGVNTLKYYVLNPKLGTSSATGTAQDTYTTAGTVIDAKISDNSEKLKIERVQKTRKKTGNKSLIILVILALFSYFGYSSYLDYQHEQAKKIKAMQEAKRRAEEERRLKEQQEEAEKEAESICLEDGLCHLPVGVQKQLVAEYKVGIKLLQAERYELAEDRAKQILAKAPEWPKALELRDVAKKEKERLIREAKKEEEEQIKARLEKTKQEFLDKATEYFKHKEYQLAREALGEVFQIDPENKLAKELSDRIDEIDRIKREMRERQEKINNEYYNDRGILNKANGYFKRQEFARAIPIFKKCSKIATYRDQRIIKIKKECAKKYRESIRLLKEMVIPELATADQLLSEGQYLQAIESYKRVLKIDYKNKNARAGLKLAKKSLTAKARDYYSRGAIAESVSDYKTACLNYNTILEFAMPGSKYYRMSLEKVKRYCSGY